MAGMPQGAPGSAPTPQEPMSPPKTDDEKLEGLQLTSTDVASIVKVNQYLVMKLGLPKLTKPDGSLDPDGELTITAYKAKQATLVATAAQADAGKAGPGVTNPAPPPPPPGAKPAFGGKASPDSKSKDEKPTYDEDEEA